LGGSFDIEIITQNQNNQADILITSAGFPTLEVLSGQVKITNYDFTQPPRNIEIGNKIGSEYTFGNLVSSQYPSIEAYSRNVAPDISYRLGIEVTPQSPGTFEIYIKTIAIPHAGEFSHFPYEGKIDSQNEFVSVYEVEVANP